MACQLLFGHPIYNGDSFKIGDLAYNEKYCLKKIVPKEKINKIFQPNCVVASERQVNEYTIFFADFEADTSTTPHTPYMYCIHSKDGSEQRTFKGEDCNTQLLDYLINFNNPCVYFHNLKYDFSFLSEYGMKDAIKDGTKLYRTTLEHNGKQIYFRDILPILSCKLSQLPSMFKINNIQKELFPYNYYTIKRLNKGGIGVISECDKDEIPQWTEEQRKQFIKNVEMIKCE